MKKSGKLVILLALVLSFVLIFAACFGGGSGDNDNPITEKFTVTLNTDGGSNVPSQTVDNKHYHYIRIKQRYIFKNNICLLLLVSQIKQFFVMPWDSWV